MVLLMYIIGLGLGYTIGTELQKHRQKTFTERKEIKTILDRRREGVPDRVKVAPHDLIQPMR